MRRSASICSGVPNRVTLLAVDIQIDAGPALQIRRDPVHAVDEILQVQSIDAGGNQLLREGVNVPIGMHVNQAARLPGRCDQPLVHRSDEPSKQLGRNQGAVLGAEVLRIAHHGGAEVKVSPHDSRAELHDHIDEPAQPRLAIHHIEQEILVASKIAQTQKRMAVFQRADTVLSLRPNGLGFAPP